MPLETLTAEVTELPGMPMPEFPTVWMVASFVYRMGLAYWKIHPIQFEKAEAAEEYASRLQPHHTHRRLIKIG